MILICVKYHYQSIAMNNTNTNDKVSEKTQEYFNIFYDYLMNDILGSVSENDYEFIKKPDMLNINMDYSKFKSVTEKGISDSEREETLKYLTEFLNVYVEFQKDEYVKITKELFSVVRNNMDQMKEYLVEHIQETKHSEHHSEHHSQDQSSDNEDNEDCNQSNPLKKQKTISMKSGIDGDNDTNTITKINSDEQKIVRWNDERGLIKFKMNGKDIEVETHGSALLSNIYLGLFTIFSMMYQMSIEHVKSDRPRLYDIDSDDTSDDIFTFMLQKIN